MILRKQRNPTVLLGEVVDIDVGQRRVLLSDGVLDYDALVVAAGATHHYFGHPEWRAHAPGLKSIEDATAIRARVLLAFETAEREPDPQLRHAWMTFVVVGGGPTGVETAGALAELITHVLTKDYPQMDLRDVRVLLIEATDHLMGNYPNELRKATVDLLHSKNVEVLVNTKLSDYNGRQITLGDGTQINAHTLIWTAGVRAAELIDQLGVQQAASGRVRVEPTLQLPQHPEVFILF